MSAPTIVKVERGDPTVAVGTMLEAAALVGVALFDEDAKTRARHLTHKGVELALLPASVRQRRKVDDDF